MDQKAAEKSVYEPSEIEDIVREWFRSYSEKDFDAHNALIHPDAVVVYPEMCFVDPDLSGGKAFLEMTLEKDEANFIDLKQTITSLWVVGNTAFVEGYFSGSRLGGTIVDQAEGSEMKLRFLDRIEIEDRKIKLIYAFYDTALLYQIQLGLEGPTKQNPIPPWMIAMRSGQARLARKPARRRSRRRASRVGGRMKGFERSDLLNVWPGAFSLGSAAVCGRCGSERGRAQRARRGRLPCQGRTPGCGRGSGRRPRRDDGLGPSHSRGARPHRQLLRRRHHLDVALAHPG